MFFFFFFSSRRRHTRLQGDWSSDVCSSDLGTNPSGGTLAGTTTVTAASGVATFGTLSVDKVETGYTLAAAATGLTGATSGSFNVTVGAATQFVFSVQPTNTAAGTAITPAVQVTALDAGGNVATGFAGSVAVALGTNPSGGTLAGTTTGPAVSGVPGFTGNVTVAITAGTGASGATLAGTTTVAAVNGVASFAALSIDKSGTGYTLAATAAGLTGAASAAFSITPGPATQLAFTGQPGTTTAGHAIAPAVQVTAQDALGNAVAGFTGSVTVALGANPGGGTLAGTTTVAATNGVASFATLSIDKAGAGYTLTAAAAGPSGATSAAFNVVAGTISATQSTVAAAPTVITAGNEAATTTVTARDAAGNPVSGAVVVLTATGTGNTLTQPAAPTDANGVATGSLTSTVAGSKTVTAAIAGVTATQTALVTVTAGAATQLAFSVQPTNAAAGATLTPAVQVTARDAQGNVATGFTGTVTVALGVNPGGATVSGTTSVAAVSGVATFSSLSIDKVGTGYTLTAADPGEGLSGVTSTAFNITPGPATQLVFTVQPSNTVAARTISPAVQVAARDAQGNLVTAFTGSVTVALGTNPSGGTLAGTTTGPAVSGVASFASLSINKVGTGYTLTAAAPFQPALTGATSAPFDITPGQAAQLLFSVQPTSTTAGAVITPAVRVTARDAQGNTATGVNGSGTGALRAKPGGATLSGP